MIWISDPSRSNRWQFPNLACGRRVFLLCGKSRIGGHISGAQLFCGLCWRLIECAFPFLAPLGGLGLGATRDKLKSADSFPKVKKMGKKTRVEDKSQSVRFTSLFFSEGFCSLIGAIRPAGKRASDAGVGALRDGSRPTPPAAGRSRNRAAFRRWLCRTLLRQEAVLTTVLTIVACAIN